jgi:hypothetical protein
VDLCAPGFQGQGKGGRFKTRLQRIGPQAFQKPLFLQRPQEADLAEPTAVLEVKAASFEMQQEAAFFFGKPQEKLARHSQVDKELGARGQLDEKMLSFALEPFYFLAAKSPAKLCQRTLSRVSIEAKNERRVPQLRPLDGVP